MRQMMFLAAASWVCGLGVSAQRSTGSHPSVEVHVDARALRVIGMDEPDKDRDEVQKTMLGPEVLGGGRCAGI